jgi:hypothetical protein
VQLQTTVYRYHTYARAILVGYIIVLIVFFMASAYLPSPAIIFLGLFVFGFPILSALSSRSPFALRSVDKKLLILNTSGIKWGTTVFSIGSAEHIKVYLHAFESFVVLLGSDGGIVREFGDKNKLEFRYEGETYEFTFFLANYGQYLSLIHILSDWQSVGNVESVRTAYSHQFIIDQMQNGYNERHDSPVKQDDGAKEPVSQ